ncbi:MAG: ABC transporter permease [Verrucomicrobia bacterium]|nr:ABC transporter permease [Verrucomicrobiota bacterium]
MSPNLRIAFRFLTAKKRAMLMSLSCTVLGVGLFIVTQATTSGFEKFFIKAILGADGAVRIEDKLQNTLRTVSAGNDFAVRSKEAQKYIEGVEEPSLVVAGLKQFPNVLGTSQVIRQNVLVSSAFKNHDSAQVFGINIDEHIKVSDLDKHIASGSLDDFRQTPTGALIGRELADRLQLSLGESFLIDVRNSPPMRFRVSAIYETGVSDIDKIRVFVHMGQARSLLRKSSGVSLIQVSLRDPARAEVEAAQMEETLGYAAKPWQRREKVWIEVFRALATSSGITVTVFTLIASLAMFNTLAMIVLEKTKDIAILRSMGYERRDITQIFLWQAGIVLAIGAVLGSAFGALATWGVSKIPLGLHGIIVTKTFPVAPSPWHYVAAVVTAIVMVMIASIIPARRAAHLEPGDIVRGAAQ